MEKKRVFIFWVKDKNISRPDPQLSGYAMPRTEPSSYTAGKINRKGYKKYIIIFFMGFGNFRVLLGSGNNNKNEDFAEYVIFQRGLQAGVFWGAL
jgi:hypothetical protein